MNMNKRKIIDYLDANLADREAQKMETTISGDHSCAEQVDDMRLAMHALHGLAQYDQIEVNENFWPRLRQKLPARPSRNPLTRVAISISALVWPSTSAWGMSLRIALVVAVAATAALWFGPKSTITPVSAITPSEQAFITRSAQRHNDFINSTPPATLPALNGDAHSVDPDHGVYTETYMP